MGNTSTLDARTLELFERLKPELPIRGNKLPNFVTWATSYPSYSLNNREAYTFETYIKRGLFSHERFWPTIIRLSSATKRVSRILNDILLTNFYLELERLAERVPSLVEGYSNLPSGVPVRAIADGVVVLVEGPHEHYADSMDKPSVVSIQHGGQEGVKSSYVHFAANVQNGRDVRKGEIIGVTRPIRAKAGQTNYTGLHFSIQDANGAFIDPVKLFSELNVIIRRGGYGTFQFLNN